jgi:hypothetical protein
MVEKSLGVKSAYRTVELTLNRPLSIMFYGPKSMK